MAQRRIEEVDLLRSIAIICMVVFHSAYDLQVFYGWDIDVFTGGWDVLRIITASLFLLVSGVSTRLSKRPLRRAVIVLLCAALISGATYVYNPSTFIYFGILHCIGLGMLILILVKTLKEWNILVGLLVAALHYPLSSFHFPLRVTLDLYPPIPWISLMFIGSGLGYWLYIRNSFSPFQHFNISPLLTLPGRHSLLVYLVHQPLILIVLGLIV